MKTIVIGAFRIGVRPDTEAFQVTGPRLPGEARRTRKSFDELENARQAATELGCVGRETPGTGSISEPYPADTIVEIKAFYTPEARIEIEAIVA